MANMIRSSKKSDTETIVKIWLDASIKAHDFMSPEYWESKVGDMKNIYIPAVNGNEKCTRNGKIKLYHPGVHWNSFLAFSATGPEDPAVAKSLFEMRLRKI
jgi:hypothetical protein